MRFVLLRQEVEEELQLAREGLDYCASGHPMRLRFLFIIGECLLRTGTHVFDFHAGVTHILEGLRENTCFVSRSLGHGIRALRSVEDACQLSIEPNGDSASGQPDYDALVLQAYILVIRLLPRAASFRLDNVGRLRELSGAEALSRNAATRAIRAGRNGEAIELLEEGRGVFWSQALRLRATELDCLPAHDAEALRTMFRTLESESKHIDSVTAAQRDSQVDHRRRLSEAAEALIADIRSRPGRERFLLPPAFTSLIEALPEGFVILLNVSELGHHAIILDGRTKCAHSLTLTLPARLVGKRRRVKQMQQSRVGPEEDEIPDGDLEQTTDLSGEEEQRTTLIQDEEQVRAGVRERATFQDSLADLWVSIVKPVIIDLLNLKVRIHALQSSFSLSNTLSEVSRS
jgi:hypothetical protein